MGWLFLASLLGFGLIGASLTIENYFEGNWNEPRFKFSVGLFIVGGAISAGSLFAIGLHEAANWGTAQ